MEGNYRHQYLASAKPAQVGATAVIATAAPVTQTRRQAQVSMAASECNGLPTQNSRHQQHRSANHVPSRAGCRVDSAHVYPSGADQQQLYSRQHTPTSRSSHPNSPQTSNTSSSSNNNNNLSSICFWSPSSDGSSSRKSAIIANQNKATSSWQHQNPTLKQSHQYYQTQTSPCGTYDDNYDGPQVPSASSSCSLNEAQSSRNIYASQLRNSQLQCRFQRQQQQHQHQRQQQTQMHQPSNQSASSDNRCPSGSAPSASAHCKLGTLEGRTSAGDRANEEPRPLHVNFNRVGRASGAARGDQEDDEADEGGGRKKKYLTAKYGQQQMNLIKKRLKIEMWLYEQLKELTKDSKAEADLDEIDIDLDQLLDMEDDSTRRHWLQKTLEPFEDVEITRINEFIDQVLEQTKLL